MSQTTPLLKVENLSLSYRRDHHWHQVVHDVSFELKAGEIVALVGESGSGKTTTAQAIIGLLAENGRRDRGAIHLNGTDISHWSPRQWQQLRGSRISLVPQDPGNSLNPVKTVGEQVEEMLKLHQRLSREQRQQRVLELLSRVGLSYPEQRVAQYPHQLSGGMKQRVLIAIALACKPELIIADEPTSALDVTVQRHILDLIDELRQETGTAVLFVTHDLALAAERADRILVFRHGELQEAGNTREVITAPRNPYTRQLLQDAVPAVERAATRRISEQNMITVEAVNKRFSLGGKQHLQALNQVSFAVKRGSLHALVGESGSGKSTLARILLGFEQADSGTITLGGTPLHNLRGEDLRQLRRRIQLVYQNPYASLDPRQTLFHIIEEPLRNFSRLSRAERREQVEAITRRVALPTELLARKPQALSGGQRQRVALARALILQPEILVLDEATSALDVTVQAQILRLIASLQDESGVTCLFITHDLATVRHIADSVTVLRHGEVIEQGDTATLFSQPAHAYTRELIAAIPHFKPLMEEPA